MCESGRRIYTPTSDHSTKHANNSAPFDHTSVCAALDALVQLRARPVVRLSEILLRFSELGLHRRSSEI
jgi:hypothetical protein